MQSTSVQSKWCIHHSTDAQIDPNMCPLFPHPVLFTITTHTHTLSSTPSAQAQSHPPLQIHTRHSRQPLQHAVALQRLCNRRCSFCTNVVEAKAVHTTMTRAAAAEEKQKRTWVPCRSVCVCVHVRGENEWERESANAHNNTALGCVTHCRKTKQ